MGRLIMAENSGKIKGIMWIGIVLFFLWFLTFTFAPQGILETLDFMEIEGYFLRMFGILPLAWLFLFLFALKDPVKNLAIIKCAILTAAALIIANLIYHFAVANLTSWFIWLSLAVLFVYNVLLFMVKPKAE